MKYIWSSLSQFWSKYWVRRSSNVTVHGTALSLFFTPILVMLELEFLNFKMFLVKEIFSVRGQLWSIVYPSVLSELLFFFKYSAQEIACKTFNK